MLSRRTLLLGAGVAPLLFSTASPTKAAAHSEQASVFPQIGHSGEISAVAFAPDGRRIVTGGRDHTLKLWDIASGREVRAFRGHCASVVAVAFSPDGRTIASTSDDRTLRLWDTATGQELRTLGGTCDEWWRVVAFSPDGRTIISGNYNGALTLWDIASGAQLRALPGDGRPLAVAFSPDGRVITSAHNKEASTSSPEADGAIRLWEADSGRELAVHALTLDHKGSIDAAALSPDGRYIVTGDNTRNDCDILIGSWSHTVTLWDSATGKSLRTLTKHDKPVWAVAFSPDGRMIASAGGEGVNKEECSLYRSSDPSFSELKLWDAASGRELHTVTGLENAGKLAFSPDSSSTVIVDHSTLKLCSITDGKNMRTFAGYGVIPRAVSLSPDGRYLISGHIDKTLTLWDAASGRGLHTLKGQEAKVNTAAFSPDGRHLISGSADHTLMLWDTATGECVRTFEGHKGEVLATAFSPDGRHIISGGGEVRLWNTVTGECLRTLGIGRSVMAVALSPDGRHIASLNDDSLQLWDATTGDALYPVHGIVISPFVSALVFSPDGHTIIPLDDSFGVTLRDTMSGKKLRSLKGHKSTVLAAAFSPDGRTIVSGSIDQTVKLWDAATGECLRTLNGYGGVVLAVAFAPDGLSITAACGGDNAITPIGAGTIRRWSTAGEPLTISLTTPDGEWLTVTPEGFFDASTNGASCLNLRRGQEVSSIDAIYAQMHRPDLVREKLAADPRGLVREAAARLNLANAF